MTELFQFTLFGLMAGCVYAIAAMGLVLTYNVSGVFNFAHGAVGMAAAFTFFELRVQRGWPTPIALAVVVLVLCPILGVIVDRLLRNFSGADFATSLVVTIALTVGLLGVVDRIYSPREARYVPPMFGEREIVVFDVPISWDQIFQVVVAVAVAFGLRFLLFGTMLGARMRAVVDDGELADLHGVKSRFVSRVGWIIGFMLAGFGGVLFAGGHNISSAVLTLLVLNAYGAAMVGRLTSLPLTFVGALALGVAEHLPSVNWLWPDGGLWPLGDDFFSRLPLAIPGLFLIAALFLVPSSRLAAGSAIGRDEPPVPTLARSIAYGLALVVAVAVGVRVAPVAMLDDIQTGLIIATVALSLVVVTGMSGQVSLTQYLFLGVGAFVIGKWANLDGVLTLVIGGVLSAVLGAVVALPAVRLKGLYLALSTFAVALIGRDLILGHPEVFGFSGPTVPRPSVLGISTGDNGTYAIWCAAAFAVLGIVVGVVRRSWFGRMVTAVRDSELAAATAGLPVRSIKLMVFSMSAFIAGCAGSLFAGSKGAVSGTNFNPVLGLIVVLYAFVGGITTVGGALIAGGLFAALSYAQEAYESLAGVVFVAVGVGAIALGRQPNGLAGMLLSRRGSRPAAPREAVAESDTEPSMEPERPLTASTTGSSA